MNKYFILLPFLFFVSFISVVGIDADTSSAYIIPRLSGAIVFDGMPDEEAWDAAEPLPVIMHLPVSGKPVSERTDVRIVYDDDYLFVGGRMYDRYPSKLRIASKKRDEFGTGSDMFALILDTYDDNENAVAFLTTPSGLRTDIAVFNDAEGDRVRPNAMPMSESWNTFWDVETQVTDEGWFLEMRIPLSSLRFQDVEGEVTMGLIVWRWIPHINEIYTYPAIPQNWEMSFWKPSQAQTIILKGAQPRRPVYITPYAIAGVGQEHALNENETAYAREDKPVLNAGLDVKYGLTSNLTMDLTVNTDFAQVEADDEMVNLTRFSLFFPEKRQFFLERSSIFDFNTGGPGTLFYSRRIGLNEDEIIPIYGGIRLIGRQGPWDIGFLTMQTAPSDSLPSENFGVLRLKKQVFNPFSYIGNIFTSRLGMDGSYNFVYGLDGLIRVVKDDYLKLIWAQSFENGMNNNPLSLNKSKYLINWERRKNVGFTYDLSMGGSGPNFDPGIGFQFRDDYTSYGGRFQYAWLSSEESPVLRHQFYIRSFNFVNTSHNTLETLRLSPGYGIELKNFCFGGLFINYQYENVLESFELSDDAIVPEGDYRFVDLAAILQTSISKPLFSMCMFQAGSYYDGKRLSASLQPVWSLSSSFQLNGYYQYNWVDFHGRNQQFVSHIARLKALYMFSTKLSVSAFVQYNSADNEIVSNLRLRYNPREGNDLYIVYNEGTNTDLDRENIRLPIMSNRTIMLKYTYTFIF